MADDVPKSRGRQWMGCKVANICKRLSAEVFGNREGDPAIRSVILAEKPSILAALSPVKLDASLSSVLFCSPCKSSSQVDHRLVTEPERLGPDWDVLA